MNGSNYSRKETEKKSLAARSGKAWRGDRSPRKVLFLLGRHRQDKLGLELLRLDLLRIVQVPFQAGTGRHVSALGDEIEELGIGGADLVVRPRVRVDRHPGEGEFRPLQGRLDLGILL